MNTDMIPHPASLFVWIICILFSCDSPSGTEVSVRVVDRATEQVLDSAAVIVFQARPGQDESVQDTFWTDEQGEVSFSLTTKQSFQYRLRAERRHYQDALADMGGQFDNETSISVGDSNHIELRLEPIMAPDPERFVKMHVEIPVKEVIGAMVSDQWTWAFLPRLSWEDVSALLAIARDTSYLHQYPHPARSRYRPDSVRVGLMALWMVEAIRRQPLESDRPGGLRLPGRAPVLGTRRGNPSGYNSPAQIETAYQAYRQWFETYQDQPAKGRRRNPLAGKGLSWM